MPEHPVHGAGVHGAGAPGVATGDGAAAFIAAMGRCATGVTIVGAADGGERLAQTVSAMASVSAAPALLLVCVNQRSPINAVIRRSGTFCVSALATRHDHVADTFAGRPWPGKDRWDFTCGRWEASEHGDPRLADALAAFDCAVHAVIEAGSHFVYVGAVRHVTTGSGPPLVYVAGAYAQPDAVAPSVFPDFPDAHPDNRLTPARASQEGSA